MGFYVILQTAALSKIVCIIRGVVLHVLAGNFDKWAWFTNK